MRNIHFLFVFLIVCLLLSCNISKSQPGSVSNLSENSLNLENFKFQFQDFEAFYVKFINDTIFQLSRIKFPIKGVFANYDLEKEWTMEAWPFIKWDLRIRIEKTNDSISIEQSENRFFYGSYCRDCGFSFEMAFDKIDKEWFLTYRQENDY